MSETEAEELLWVGSAGLVFESIRNLRTTLTGAEKMTLGRIDEDLREDGGSLDKRTSESSFRSGMKGVSILISW